MTRPHRSPTTGRSRGIGARLEIADDVARALASSAPVVALESTLISHGLPYPANLEVALAAERAVRSGGAVPATIAIRDGRILVGLAAADIESLARAPAGSVAKAARPSLAAALDGGWAATTVSATMIAAHAAGIRVFATGGIGGVHHGSGFDVSSDLTELARTPMAVVCAGPKSILDVAATLEVLETHGVPVVTLGSEELPGFVSRGAGLASPAVAVDEPALASLVRTHLDLDLGNSILVCVPVPADAALPDDVNREATSRALADAAAAGVRGPDLTPWLLGRLAALTDGASVRANTALIVNNAAHAARLAAAIASP